MNMDKQIENQEKSLRRKGKKRISPIALSLLAIVGFVATMSVAADHWMKNSIKVTSIVTGTRLLSVKDILRSARVPDTTVLADIDLMAVKNRIESNPVVEEAILRRNPPSTLEIEIRERTPVALLINVGEHDCLVDKDGYILPSVSSVPLHALPVITGAHGLAYVTPGKHVQNRRLLQVLDVLRRVQEADPDALHLFSEASLDGRTDVTLYTLEAGVPVILDPAGDMRRIMKIFRSYWENVALQHDVRDLEYIDLRFRDQAVVRWIPGAGPVPRGAVIDTTAILPD